MREILTALLMVLSADILSQEVDIYKTMATEVCECMAKRSKDKTVLDEKEFEFFAGSCILDGISKYKIDIDKTDLSVMDKFGEKMGMLMLPICPEVFQKLIGDNMLESNESLLSGKIKTVEHGDFVYFNFIEESGKEHKLIWLSYFPGSEELQDNPKQIIGKQVIVRFKTTEAFSPKSRTYYNSKEITGLKFIEN